MDQGQVRNKMEALNDLIRRGYNLCFLIDVLVNDFVTNGMMLEFHGDVLRKWPDPSDTTGTYKDKDADIPASPEPKERKPCRILHLTSRPPSPKGD